MPPHLLAHQAYVGVGSNLDEPLQQVRAAIAELAEMPGSRVTGRSSLYRSAPIGKADQPDYINAVVEIATDLSPEGLLGQLGAIEARHGRVRGERNAPRTLDLDLLLYDQAVIETPDLTVPHPRMHERAFVLLPLAELAPTAIVPGHGAVEALLPGVAAQRLERLG
jgi:2-amino-4-hydroxy-6-hydroxymethyldihydropteridine diphosphokinase